jgi:hypothetical protein
MTPDDGVQRTSGEFVRATKSLPGILVDASAWARAPGPHTSGEFVRATKSLPGIPVDASTWGQQLTGFAEELARWLANLDQAKKVEALSSLVNTLSEAYGLQVELHRKPA